MSYVSSHFHIVYSTKERVPSIPETLQPKLWAYTAGIAANHGRARWPSAGLKTMCTP
ncbi:MAG TPA: hypothetical protein VJW20_13635 [Candidatus Angelobacter sp.]|nr:hypothetical protein [Candidatus Angelobacter sp.]